jgi:CBS domain-containing protein
VLDAKGKLAGVVSVDDLVLLADSEDRGSLSCGLVVHSLKKLYSS